jgi:hypothetical protein
MNPGIFPLKDDLFQICVDPDDSLYYGQVIEIAGDRYEIITEPRYVLQGYNGGTLPQTTFDARLIHKIK